jgi:hypothetical protein
MPEYFISYHTGNPRKLYCRCSIVSLSDEGLDLFKQKSKIDSISCFALECITDIPRGTTEEIYEHDELLRTFDRERNDSMVSLWHVQQCVKGWNDREPSGNYAYIKKMLIFQSLAKNIKVAEDKTADTSQGSSAESNPCCSIPISTPQRGRPITPLNKYFIDQCRKNPDKSVPDLVDEFNKKPTPMRAEILGISPSQVRRISAEEQEAIFAAVNRDKKKRKSKNVDGINRRN